MSGTCVDMQESFAELPMVRLKNVDHKELAMSKNS